MTRLFEAKPFIIAEVGSNWRSLDDCLESIKVAAECGADAVKFQAFSHEALYGQPRLQTMSPQLKSITDAVVRYWGGDPTIYDSGQGFGELPLDWLPNLKTRADLHGIEFMCSAFSPELVAAVDPYVSVHKVASAEAAWPQLLEAVAKTGKPVLVSLGAKTKGERLAVLERFEYDQRLVLMACVAAYPADFCDIDLVAGIYQHDACDGLSDHTLGYTAAVEAARRGAIAIEKHFTAFPDLDTPDRPHSLTPKQFKRMVDLIRWREVESEEGAMFLRHNRRLIATRDIASGETLRYGENYGAYRSLVDDTRGLSPFAWERVEGKAATVAIKRGASIGEGDFA